MKEQSPEKVLQDRLELQQTRWYVLSVKLFHERRIARLLNEKGLETYVPVRRELHTWSDRKKWIDRVLAPQLVFVRIAMKDKNLVFVDRFVVKYVSLPKTSKPASIPEEQMNAFMTLTRHSQEEISMIQSPLHKGDKVLILSGSLIGLEGELLRIDGKTQVLVRLNDALSAVVTLASDMVEKIPQH